MPSAYQTPHIRDRWLLDLYLEQEGRCYSCGVVMTNYRIGDKRIQKGQAATFEHVVPQSKGGADGRYNLVLTCETCNTSRGNGRLIHYSERFTGQVNLLCQYYEKSLQTRFEQLQEKELQELEVLRQETVMARMAS